jgi:sugar phosphate isomerase/epimerase
MPSPYRLGVCSWSLRARSPRDLAERVRAANLDAVQLALEPLRTGAWGIDDVRRELGAARVEIRSGMWAPFGEDYSTLESIRRTGGVRPTEHWPRNLEAVKADARIARELGIALVSFHAGFLPHDTGDPERAGMLERLRVIADLFANAGVRVAFETGQESAETLLAALADLDHPSVGVNFDPANLLLYGMGDPIEALRQLAPYVRQVHVKDARRTPAPGAWGEEVPVGQGEVDWQRFFELLAERSIACDLMIERESGEDRVADIRMARALVACFVDQPGAPGA